VALIYGLQKARRTGILEVRSARHWRRLYVIDGVPCWSASDRIDDELARSLVQAGAIPEKELSQFRRKLGPYDGLDKALLAAGRLDGSRLAEHRLMLVEPGIGAPVGWERGDWSFEARDSLPLAALDPELFPSVSALRGLWEAVRHFVRMDEALPAVVDTAAGRLRPSPDLARSLPALGLTDPLDGFSAALGEGIAVEELFKKIPDRSGHLVLLVWFLQMVGLIRRDDNAMDKGLLKLAEGRDLASASALMWPGHAESTASRAVSTPAAKPKPKKTSPPPADAVASAKAAPAASKPTRTQASRRARGSSEGTFAHETRRSTKQSKPMAKEVEHLARLIRTAHRHRMGQDFYAFLDLNRAADSDEIRDAYERLTRGWQAAADNSALPPEDRLLVDELNAAAILVWQTLSDARQRDEYDSRLSMGTAPVLSGLGQQQDLPSASTAGDGELLPEHLKARKLMALGKFGEALSILEDVRESQPSSAEVLADLGWSAWRSKQMGHEGDEGPEDYLLLANTFEPRCVRALEFLARMSKEKEDLAQLKTWTKRLLAVVPDHPWAKSELKKLSSRRGSGR